MKSILYTIAISLLMLASAGQSKADNRPESDWKQKIMSEKIAFLTVELGITPEEAQVFWPVYNQVDKERDEAMKKVFLSFRAMEEAVAAGKSEKDISKLLEEYLEALDNQGSIERNAYKAYEKVLPTEKLAKLYISEEKFRRQHIRKLHTGDSKPGPKR